MHPTSDPKTSQNNAESVAFQDRLYVAGNASFLCLTVAIVWSIFCFTKWSISPMLLVILASPLVATGATVLIAGLSKDLVPKPNLSSPLHISIPVIWCLICYLTILIISTQEMGSSSVPEQLVPAMAWSKITNLVPLCAAQMVVLGAFVMLDRKRGNS